MERGEIWKQKRMLRIKQVLGYFAFYMIVFGLLEHRDVHHYMLNSRLDELIPYIPAFVLPYFLWFAFVPLTVGYFALVQEDDAEYERFARMMFVGNTLFLLISFLFPNGQGLRPLFVGDSFCGHLVGLLYASDTPTNVLPSMHVFDSAACCIALMRSARLREKRVLRVAVMALTVSIVLSTMFIKQHTVLDVVSALVLSDMCMGWFYNPSRRRSKHLGKPFELPGR